MAFGVDDESKGRKWFFRIASIAGLVAAFTAGSVFGSIGWAKRYVEGVEGDQRHEWYAFIISLKVDGTTFRHYGPREYGIAGTSAEACLSEIGLRRLIKYSAHRDAGALGLWLERDVLRVLRNRRERNAA